MSVSVQNLSKHYDGQKAVDSISFEAGPGEILGFLGPNGAGKSTTMKILTCYLPATSGTALVCGFHVQRQPMQVRRQVGYLPELNPLYGDMYVKEYLRFMASVHGMGKTGTTAVDGMIDRVGLQQESRKKISQLSKGYKQRVGLAQAMLHNPKVLILDEPTSGLDPNQIVEIRNLILEMGRDKTVILSTHIMQEVQALCQRVIIINKGRLVADSPVSQLGSQQTDHFVQVEFNKPVSPAMLEAIGGVSSVQNTGGNCYRIRSVADVRELLFRFAVEQNVELLSLSKEEQSLEEIFKQVTAG